MKRFLKMLLALVVLLGGFVVFLLTPPGRKLLVRHFTPEYEVEGDPTDMRPEFSGVDLARSRVDVGLDLMIGGFSQITDMQFLPGSSSQLLVAQKTGALTWVDLTTETRKVLLELPVSVVSEQGLLGLCFHPGFLENGRMYVNYTLVLDGKDISRVAQWKARNPEDLSQGLADELIIMEVEQPYQNHNAGALAFGPDGMFYIGWGDGGWMHDPEKNGQDPSNWLGSMLRIDVERPVSDEPYGIPEDNPFVDVAGVLPETWAYGLRNPWKYCFAPDGRLIVADVGQDTWEEVSVVSAGGNYGWNLREGAHCFPPDRNCREEGLIDPIYEYDREDGYSITGGFVYTGRLNALRDKYIFGDFVTGRIWALILPDEEGKSVKEVYALGKWPVLISTFGVDADGEVYVGDFASGNIYRFAAPSN